MQIKYDKKRIKKNKEKIPKLPKLSLKKNCVVL